MAREDITDAEHEACWRTDEEWADTKRGTNAAVLRAKLRQRDAVSADDRADEDNDDDKNQGDDDHDESLCLRGLEHVADAAVVIKRAKRVRRSAMAVLELQKNLLRNNEGAIDPEAVRRASRRASSAARRDAGRVGAEDARAIAEIPRGPRSRATTISTGGGSSATNNKAVLAAAAKVLGIPRALPSLALSSVSTLETCQQGDTTTRARRRRGESSPSELLDRVRAITAGGGGGERAQRRGRPQQTTAAVTPKEEANGALLLERIRSITGGRAAPTEHKTDSAEPTGYMPFSGMLGMMSRTVDG